jgi:hypothetical protein
MEFLNENEKEVYSKLSPSKRIPWLKDLSLGFEKGENLSKIQDMLLVLEEEDRQFSVMEPRQFISPHDFDVLITDIKESDFIAIAEEVGVVRLSPANIEPPETYFPVQGIIYGGCNRLFVNLVVTKRSTCLNVLFLVDPGSPNTHLREDTFAALGYTGSTPSDALVKINNLGLTVYLSRAHYSNVDLLGQDFFVSLGAKMTINYREKSLLIEQL